MNRILLILLTQQSVERTRTVMEQRDLQTLCPASKKSIRPLTLRFSRHKLYQLDIAAAAAHSDAIQILEVLG